MASSWHAKKPSKRNREEKETKQIKQDEQKTDNSNISNRLLVLLNPDWHLTGNTMRLRFSWYPAMRLCNADVDEAERNPAQFEDFDELNEDAEGGSEMHRAEQSQNWVRHQGSSKSFFDLRQRTLSGMDLMPAFRVVVLGLARKLKNNTKDQLDNQLDNHCKTFVKATIANLLSKLLDLLELQNTAGPN